jgi:hypothetical protein
MHIIFGSVHVTGAYASTPVDLADSPNDNEVDEDEKKTPSDVSVSGLPKKGKKCNVHSSHGIEDTKERSSFLLLYKNTCSKIQGVQKLTSSVETSSASLTSTQIPTIA